jgi:hypothetical protein
MLTSNNVLTPFGYNVDLDHPHPCQVVPLSEGKVAESPLTIPGFVQGHLGSVLLGFDAVKKCRQYKTCCF